MYLAFSIIFLGACSSKSGKGSTEETAAIDSLNHASSKMDSVAAELDKSKSKIDSSVQEVNKLIKDL